MKVTKRQLAMQFVAMLEATPLDQLAPAFIEAAQEAGYTHRDTGALMSAVETELKYRFGVVEVAITTARDTEKVTLEQIAGELTKAAGAKQFSYTHTVDPELLGGFEASAGGVAVRSSIRSNLSGVTNG